MQILPTKVDGACSQTWTMALCTSNEQHPEISELLWDHRAPFRPCNQFNNQVIWSHSTHPAEKYPKAAAFWVQKHEGAGTLRLWSTRLWDRNQQGTLKGVKSRLQQ